VDKLFEITSEGLKPFRRTIEMWDTSGEPQFRSVIPYYLRGSNGVVFVYDATDPDSFLGLEK
jgi:Ras-related protein Rab-1A